jgi:ferredoxin
MGIFISVEVEPALCSPDGGAKLVNVCPVNVFELAEGQVVIDSENEDECTLCGLCLNVYPAGAVRVRRLYRE